MSSWRARRTLGLGGTQPWTRRYCVRFRGSEAFAQHISDERVIVALAPAKFAYRASEFFKSSPREANVQDRVALESSSD